MKRIGALFLMACFAVAAFGSASKTILILGDSLAAGYGVDPDEAYPALIQKKIEASGLNYNVVNAGVSGDTTAGGLRRLTWVLRQPVDIFVLELGGNDGLRGVSPDETEKNLDAIIAKVKEKNPNVKVVIAGMEMPGIAGQEFTQKFRAAFSNAAKKNGALLIPFLLEGVGGKPELNQADRVHPTREGHKIVAENVWKVLKPLLKQGG
ncbi:MAG TPA: arylesterase [Verrucomicrobiae bacterium]|nr:arylesterase [Verrucomicrobiae bacterium]